MSKSTSIIAFLGLLAILSCSDRKKVLFRASDELHIVTLYEQDEMFELLYNGFNTAKGTYVLEGDTIYLTYKENQFNEFDSNAILTGVLVIDKASKKVRSLDSKVNFCAFIEVDNRINRVNK